MLLAIDVGNTDTKFGIYKDGEWLAVWRRPTELVTGPQTGDWLREQANEANIGLAIDSAVCASVVPPIEPVLSEICRTLGAELRFVGVTIKLPFTIRYENPSKLGADRIANILGALQELNPPLIVVDIGTATTFEAVNRDRVFLGGAILPGPELLSTALAANTAQLPKIELSPPSAFIGGSTEQALRSGIVHGYVGALESLIKGMNQELGGAATVILTGGRAQHFLELSPLFKHYIPRLTLEGIAAFASL